MAEVTRFRLVCSLLVSLQCGFNIPPSGPPVPSVEAKGLTLNSRHFMTGPHLLLHTLLPLTTLPTTRTASVPLNMLDALLPWGLSLAIPQPAVSVLLPCFTSRSELIPSMRTDNSIYNFSLPTTAALLIPPILFHFFPIELFAFDVIYTSIVFLFIVPLPLPECRPNEFRDL